MALHSKSDFAKLCGLTTGNLTNYISGKNRKREVIMSGDYIDDSIAMNRDFLLKRAAAKSKKNTVPFPSTNSIKEEVIQIPNVSEPDFKPKTGNISAPEESGYALDKKYRAQQLEKIEVETRLLELKEEKIRGEVVPMELVKQIFKSHQQSKITSDKDGLEALLTEFSKEVRLTGEQTARLRGKIIAILNNSTQKAVAMTNKNLDVIINEFSIKKEVADNE